MCRLVYELAQFKYGAAYRFKSLDDNYIVPGSERLVYGRVTHDHVQIRTNEINATQGDIVRFLEYNWDGYVNVTNPKKKQTGVIPAFKIDGIYKLHNYFSKIKT